MNKFTIYDLIDRDGMPKIENGILNLAGKGLTSLEGLQTIEGVAAINRLDLSSNQLDTLVAGIFSGLSN